MQKVFLLSLALAAELFFAAPALAQTAEVTFYSEASVAKTLLPYTSDAAFYGWLYDGDQKLAWINHGQFVTFALPAGSHRFSTSKHPDKAHELSLDLPAGQHQFVSLSSTVKNAVVWTFVNSILTPVDCSTARAAGVKAKPVKGKYVPKEVRQELVSTAAFPECTP